MTQDITLSTPECLMALACAYTEQCQHGTFPWQVISTAARPAPMNQSNVSYLRSLGNNKSFAFLAGPFENSQEFRIGICIY